MMFLFVDNLKAKKKERLASLRRKACELFQRQEESGLSLFVAFTLILIGCNLLNFVFLQYQL